MSCRTIVYKGMLNASQLLTFYPDLLDDRASRAPIAIVHSRFSTNTFPSWARAHPYRYISHNGEINTLRGNVNWMHARQSSLRSSVFGDDLHEGAARPWTWTAPTPRSSTTSSSCSTCRAARWPTR